MKNSILWRYLTSENLKDLIRDLFGDLFRDLFREVIREESLSPKLPQPISEDTLYTRREMAIKLKLSLPTLSVYTREGRIRGKRIGSRVLYTEQALQDALKEIPITKGKRA